MRKILRYSLLLLCSLHGLTLSAQSDSTWRQLPTLHVSGFMDVFYVYDLNRPQGASRQPFLFNHNRHNEFNLNLGLVRLSAEHEKYRANLAFHAGTYANDNYAAEPGVLRHIFEANIGLSLNKANNLWLDAGVLPSHIGFESAVSMDNWTLTRSLLAENSPYFLTGAKLTFSPSDKWSVAGLVVNGWQRIQRLAGNSLPSFGTQVTFSPSEAVSLNWSTLIGTDDPDTTRRMRYFSNLYGQFALSRHFGIIVGFDIGMQQQASGSDNYHMWFSPVIIGRATIGSRWGIALRGEFYQDRRGIIIQTTTLNGFGTGGVSLNVDYSPAKQVMCRLEGRWMGSRDRLFETPHAPSANNFIVAASVAVRLAGRLGK
jgi:hypothetical protein